MPNKITYPNANVGSIARNVMFYIEALGYDCNTYITALYMASDAGLTYTKASIVADKAQKAEWHDQPKLSWER